MKNWLKKGGLRLQTGIILVIAISIWFILNPIKTSSTNFNGELALASVNEQINFGPRIPGSDAHRVFIDWAANELSASGWNVEMPVEQVLEIPIQNIVAKKGNHGPLLILGAHYDSRLKADQDHDFPEQPVPGANDGASGVAVLLELARCLKVPAEMQVWLVLFDAEDQGNLPGWDWILGSGVFAESLTETPAAVVVVDMIGDRNLNIRYEQNSNPAIREEIWNIAGSLGYQRAFIPEEGYSILDDHTPFLRKGIPAVDIIDFDYPYWHTTQDTPDKVSAESLEMVGRTLQTWVESYQP